MLTALGLLLSPVKILFVGNSLLMVNDVPAMVSHMLQSDGSGRQVLYKSYFVDHLEHVPPGSEVDKAVTSGGYNIVVLQSAMVSSSLTRLYPQPRAIAMAQAAKAQGARVLLYVEWPRRGIDETEFTMNVYKGIAKSTGAEIVPVCYSWNLVRRDAPSIDLYNPDGNHALVAGSYVAAATTYFHIAGTKATPKWWPNTLSAQVAQICLAESRRIESRPKS